MQNNFALHTIILMALPGVLAAAVGLDSRISVLEAQMNEVSTRTVHGNIGTKTASASPQIMGENWYFTGDMLWWHVDEGGTDYAQIVEAPIASALSNTIDNRRLTFDWDFGFRAGIGKIFAHDKWDLFLNFTWFKAKSSAVSSIDGGALITPLLIIPNAGINEATQVKAHWNIHFYALDLNLGRSYFVSPKLAFHPYAGVKTAWISQHVRSSADLIMPVVATIRSNISNGFWGIGPSLGCEGKWFLDYGFYLFGNAGGAALWGDFTVRNKNYIPGETELFKNFSLSLHQISPMVQLQIGLGFETNLYHNCYHLSVNAGYENQYWWNQNQMPQFNIISVETFQRPAEDLSFQGLTVNVRFDF